MPMVLYRMGVLIQAAGLRRSGDVMVGAPVALPPPASVRLNGGLHATRVDRNGTR